MKNWVVTYINPATGRDLKLGQCVRHEKDCRVFKRTSYRPWTGQRQATPEEMRSQRECKIC